MPYKPLSLRAYYTLIYEHIILENYGIMFSNLGIIPKPGHLYEGIGLGKGGDNYGGRRSALRQIIITRSSTTWIVDDNKDRILLNRNIS